jgi:hypothetical protein
MSDTTVTVLCDNAAHSGRRVVVARFRRLDLLPERWTGESSSGTALTRLVDGAPLKLGETRRSSDDPTSRWWRWRLECDKCRRLNVSRRLNVPARHDRLCDVLDDIATRGEIAVALTTLAAKLQALDE